MAALAAAPFFLVLTVYAIWTLVTGNAETKPSAILFDVVMIIIIAGVPGMLAAYTYGYYLESLKPLVEFETTLDTFVEELRKFRNELGGDARVALSRNGMISPLDLSVISTTKLPQNTHDTPAPTALVLAV